MKQNLGVFYFVCLFVGFVTVSIETLQWYIQCCTLRPRGDDLVSIMPVCVCPKVKEMASFSALREWNE